MFAPRGCAPGGGCLLPGRSALGVPGWGVCSRREVPGPGGLLSGVCSWGGDAWWRPPRTATAAGGTHPTGMHSCFTNKFYSENL